MQSAKSAWAVLPDWASIVAVCDLAERMTSIEPVMVVPPCHQLGDWEVFRSSACHGDCRCLGVYDGTGIESLFRDMEDWYKER